MNCIAVPVRTLGFKGVTAMLTNVGGDTLRVAAVLTTPNVAVICVVPIPIWWPGLAGPAYC